jgi:hypothetical protein
MWERSYRIFTVNEVAKSKPTDFRCGHRTVEGDQEDRLFDVCCFAEEKT